MQAFIGEFWSTARDRFTLTGVLRRTAATQVLTGIDGTGRAVVVKLLDVQAAQAEAVTLTRFEREAAIAERIRHPALARFLGRGPDWIAFEKLDDGLVDRVRCGLCADTATIRAVLGELAALLAHLHACGIVHCDVKPAHVRLREGRAVLIDFGAAGLVGADPLAGREQVGTPAWMAPEQLAGGQPSPAADVWSLCAIGVWLLAGAPAIAGSADDMLARRAAGWRPGLGHAPAGVSDQGLAQALTEGLGPPRARPTAGALARRLAAA